jgi:hypothetical protein
MFWLNKMTVALAEEGKQVFPLLVLHGVVATGYINVY